MTHPLLASPPATVPDNPVSSVSPIHIPRTSMACNIIDHRKIQLYPAPIMISISGNPGVGSTTPFAQDKMKTIHHVIAVMLGLAIGVFLPGCAGTKIRQLTGQEFLNQANQIGQLNSFHWTTYIGSSPERAYLEFGYPTPFGRGTRTTVYWTPLAELPEDVVLQLKAGSPPWKPWQPETNNMERTGGTVRR